jgi:alpha-mannosidase
MGLVAFARWSNRIAVFLICLFGLFCSSTQAEPAGRVLVLQAHSLGIQDNASIAVAFSRTPLTIRAGDVLEYDLWISPEGRYRSAGIEIGCWESGARHETQAMEEGGSKSGAEGWIVRREPLGALQNEIADRWQIGLTLEGKQQGCRKVAVDNVQLIRASGETIPIFEEDSPSAGETGRLEGVSSQYVLRALPLEALRDSSPDTVLVACAKNLSRGEGDCFTHLRLTPLGFPMEPGMMLEYDVFVPPNSESAEAGINLYFGHELLLDRYDVMKGFEDSANQGPWRHVAMAVPKEFERGYAVEAGILFDGDRRGEYLAFFDNIRLIRNGEVFCSIYDDGPATYQGVGDSGYIGFTKRGYLGAFEREQAEREASRPTFLRTIQKKMQAADAYRKLYEEVRFAGEALNRQGYQDRRKEVDRTLSGLDSYLLEEQSTETFLSRLHTAQSQFDKALDSLPAHNHARMFDCGGRLVGHAHIDLQWLWKWDETIDKIIPDTFGQAVRFMDEYPDFTFSQSTAALYLETEKHHPELFKQIGEKVKKGQWEVVGGRWCEGDSNMVSGEAYARQLLMGQSYFRDRFGVVCNYYFCRGGKGIPLFWWEAPDGSRLLAFEETATGSWYNGAIDENVMHEVFDWEQATGSKELLMVYGVGNHGGGPTRKHIDSAIEIMDSPVLPDLKFSTAKDFFESISEKVDPNRIPVVRDEMNPVFDGCYTSQCDVKWWNRRWKERLPALETLRIAAARYAALDYPRAELEQQWRDLLFIHHHDSITGSGIHPANDHTRALCAQRWAEADELERQAMQALSERIPPSGNPDTLSRILLFSGSGFDRMMTVCLTAQEIGLEPGTAVSIVDPDGEVHPSQWVETRADSEKTEMKLEFAAEAPSCGWTVVDLVTEERQKPSELCLEAGEYRFVLESPALRVTVDRKTGEVSSIFDRKTDKELLAEGRSARLLDIHERDNHMSAWSLGEFLSTEPLGEVAQSRVLANGPVKVAVELQWQWRSSKVFQEIALEGEGDQVNFRTSFDWHEKASVEEGARLIKFEMPSALACDRALYEIPFGWIEREASRGEVPASRWAAQSEGESTLALLNDSRHGHDVKNGALRLSLIRSSRYPDPEPNQGWHSTRYAIAPFSGKFDPAAITRKAAAFNAHNAVFSFRTNRKAASLPVRASLLRVQTPGTILSAFKMAEDNSDIVARLCDYSGRYSELDLRFDLPVADARSVDLLERDAPDELEPRFFENRILRMAKPHEIVSIRMACQSGVGTAHP